jgi:hypothetical protein
MLCHLAAQWQQQQQRRLDFLGRDLPETVARSIAEGVCGLPGGCCVGIVS